MKSLWVICYNHYQDACLYALDPLFSYRLIYLAIFIQLQAKSTFTLQASNFCKHSYSAIILLHPLYKQHSYHEISNFMAACLFSATVTIDPSSLARPEEYLIIHKGISDYITWKDGIMKVNLSSAFLLAY